MWRTKGKRYILIALFAFGLLARSAGAMCEHMPSSLTITSLEIGRNCTPLYAGSINEAIWVTQPGCGELGYISGLQVAPAFETPLRAALPTTGIAGRDSVWFIDAGNEMLYRLSSSEPVKLSFALRPQGNPQSVTVDQSGRPWITMARPSALGRLTTAGTLEYACVPSSSAPSMITAGSSGEIYFTESAGTKLGRIGTDDTFSELNLVVDGTVSWRRMGHLSWEGNMYCNGPAEEIDAQALLAAMLSDPPSRLIVDGIGNIWMTQSACRDKRCGAIVGASSTGTLHHYYIPTPNSKPADLDIGCDDAIWFTEFAGGKIGRLSRDGRVKEYRLPRGSAPFGIAFGRLWILYYTEPTKDRVNYSTSTAIKGQVVP